MEQKADLSEVASFDASKLKHVKTVEKNMASLILEVNLLFLLCFTLYLRAIFQVQAPGGLIFGGAI